MTTLEIKVLYTIATVLIMFSGVPIGFVIETVYFMPISQVLIVAENVYSEFNNFSLLTIPLFIFVGASIDVSKAGSK